MPAPPGDAEPRGLTEYTVAEVARRLGLPVATLRSWNRRYGIGPLQHRPGRHRHYTEDDLAVVTRMVELVRAGAVPASAARAARAMSGPVPALGDAAAVVAASAAMDVTRLLSLLGAHLAHHGVNATWNLLCRPAFDTIVARQQAGLGYIEVEHLLTWAITASLHRIVPLLPDAPGLPGGVVLACTDGEQHVLPLEVLRAGLAERGHAALLLGASVPPTALADALVSNGPPVTVVLWSHSAFTAGPASVRVAESHADRVLLAGPGWNQDKRARQHRHLTSLEAALDTLTSP
ncbi:MerR family transcriptional regulator [Nocardia inohanensis]|uniref:MerR family transcriptional regulator n=1 Tax=Nocardia inohanensis TaxID=209246 RepID=UPI000836E089|nr:MerR family transcriptional regulator [Nocardia inohanensis]